MDSCSNKCSNWRWRWRLRTINCSDRAPNFKRGILNSEIGILNCSDRTLSFKREVLKSTGSRESYKQ